MIIVDTKQSMGDKHQLHAIIFGRVQGVNLRYHTVIRAREMGITGWVRNLPDGTVEVMAEGTRSQLEQFLKFLYRGSPVARVKDVRYQWTTASEQFASFDVG